ncbi:hypothetical protein EMWEY_00021080 [Eimeria maxima]|uniref:UBC core domain-containing protein n=1 Tax=Eimeria maxima TaxID=5804 RepID=U6M4N6_EIMMA|nr:hypothetical protein EMWEY_00021080 [Eimeria maxima]CDJ56630.1 hypothetical protein EMWEY_00021080 [Eimeria maxima]
MRPRRPVMYNDGNICLDILQSQWSPIYDISAILTSIQSLLSDPNPSSPANQEAARLYAENRREYNRRVQLCATESLKTVGAPEAEAPGAAASASAGPPSGDPTSTTPAQESTPEGIATRDRDAPVAVQREQQIDGGSEQQHLGEGRQGPPGAP